MRGSEWPRTSHFARCPTNETADASAQGLIRVLQGREEILTGGSFAIHEWETVWPDV